MFMDMLPALWVSGVFINAVFLDVIWAFYIRRTAEGLAFQAAFWGALTIVSGGLNVIFFTQNPWLILVAATGAFLGTFFTVRKDHDNTKTTAPSG